MSEMEAAGRLRKEVNLFTKCFINTIHYSFADRAGTVRVPDNSTPNMRGVIRLFEMLDDRVEVIKVTGDAHIIAAYHKSQEDVWLATDTSGTTSVVRGDFAKHLKEPS